MERGRAGLCHVRGGEGQLIPAPRLCVLGTPPADLLSGQERAVCCSVPRFPHLCSGARSPGPTLPVGYRSGSCWSEAGHPGLGWCGVRVSVWPLSPTSSGFAQDILVSTLESSVSGNPRTVGHPAEWRVRSSPPEPLCSGTSPLRQGNGLGV